MKSGEISQMRASIAGPRSLELRELEKKYLYFGFHAESMRVWQFMVAETKGCIIKDVDGNEYIDLNSGFAVCNVGNLHPRVVEAVISQLKSLGHVCGHLGRHEVMLKLAKRLAEIAPEGLTRTAFRQSGAEAVESAIAVARAYTKRPTLITFLRGYHGCTMGALGVSPMTWRTGWHPFLTPAVYVMPYAYCYRCYLNLSYPDCNLACVDYIDKFIRSVTLDPKVDIAGLIVEPIQGVAGYIVPPDDYLPSLARLCKEHDILFIVDEIQTGFGRTGKMFAVNHYSLVPDIMVLGKPLGGGVFPLSAIVGKDEILNIPFPCCGTFTGNPPACAAGLATIDIILDERLPERAMKLGKILMKRLEEIKSNHNLVGDVRGKGLLNAIEFVSDRKKKTPAVAETEQVFEEMQKRGVAAMGYRGENSIRIAPPLTIPQELLEKALNVIEDAIKAVEKRC